MDDRELDQILEEIKQRSQPKEEAPKPAAPAEVKREQPVVKKEEPSVFAAPAQPELTIEETPIHETTPEPAAETPLPKAEEAPQEETADAQKEAEENAVDLTSFAEESEAASADAPVKKKKSKKPFIIAVIVVLIIALAAGIYFAFFHDKAEEETTTKPAKQSSSLFVREKDESNGILNPLTGENDYNEAALTQRPVAVVVENEYSTESVRPQWGLSDADIVLEGESEYSTRLLLFWADYTKLPEQVGPTRSARPPYIRFSQLFDAVFIHAGLSRSKGNYTGADEVFVNENIDHINLLSYSENGTYFGRDRSRTSTIEHTGYLNGTNTAQLLAEAGIDTTLKESKFTRLSFNKEAEALSETKAESVSFIWSDIYANGKCPKTGKFTYDAESQKYTTTDFDSDYGKANLAFENLIFLLDDTEYIVKANYKGSGKGETYCDYKLSGGKGTVLSEGTAVAIDWGVTDGKLWLKTEDGKELSLNPGKSYIGYGSSNHGGKVTLNPQGSEVE